MKKIVLLICLITFSLSYAYSQTALEEVVYLKNGSIIRGTIVEQVPNELIKLQTKDGSIFVYQMDEIERITKEPISGKSNIHQGVRKGYIGLSLGPAFPIGDVSGLPIGGNLSLIDFGYLFHQNFGMSGKWFGTAHVEDDISFGLGGLLIGFLGSAPLSEKINFEGRLMGGFGAFTASYGNSTETSDGYFAYDVGVGLRFNTSEKVSLLLNADLLGADDYKSINLSFGVAYRLR